MSGQTFDSTIDMMKKSSLFVSLGLNELQLISATFFRKVYDIGDIVFSEGSFSEYVYFVESGQFEIVDYNPKTKVSKQLRKLTSGEHFSELSVLTNSRHHTSAFAIEPGVLLKVDRSTFHKLLREYPTIAMNLARDIARLIDKTLDRSNFFKSVSDKTVVRSEAGMLNVIPLKMMQKFKCAPLRMENDHLIVGMTNPLDLHFYHEFVKQNPKISIRSVLLNEKQLQDYIQSFRSFESGLRSNVNLNSAGDAGLGQLIPTSDLDENSRDAERVLRLKKSLLFSKIPAEIIEGLLPYLEFRTVSPFENLISPEKDTDSFILVMGGHIRVLKTHPLVNSMMSLYRCADGDSVFDPSILTKAKPRLIIRSNSRCEICVIPKNVYEQLFKSVDFVLAVLHTLAINLQKLNKFNDGIQVQEQINLDAAIELNSFFPQELMAEFSLLPISQNGAEVTVVSSKPTSRLLIEAIEKAKPRVYFNLKLAPEEKIEYWKNQIKAAVPQSLGKQVRKSSKRIENSDTAIYSSKSNDPTLIFDEVIATAIQNRSSDIHIEFLQNYVLVRFRVDGELLQLWKNLELSLGQAIVRKAKILGNLDISESRLPQDGQFSQVIGEQEYGFRLSTVPTRFGEKVVIRIASRSASVIPLRHLSNHAPTAEFLLNIPKHKQGLFLVAGPTGSGKSTTIYSMLSEINRPGVNLTTVEDPIEVNLSGVNQIEIQTAIGLTYDVILRHLLRQDPDVIFIGEIRDATSLQTALDASMTGHLVLSTIHAADSLSVIPRLVELAGGQNSRIASTLIGVLSQRLVRTLCPDCKVSQPLSPYEKSRLNRADLKRYNITHSFHPVGCHECHMTGYRGQSPIFEFWKNNPSVADLINKGAGPATISEALDKDSFHSMEQYGLRMVGLGVTSLKEIEENSYGSTHANPEDTENSLKKVS